MARAAKPRPPAPRRVRLLIATRKGLWTLAGDATRRAWKLTGPQFLGNMVHHAVLDPREGKTMLAAARTGHLGPTIFRSLDGGKSWKEAGKPPAFTADSGRVVDHTFWLTPGHASQPGVWYAGTSPQGLFRSRDGGATWEGVAGFNGHPQRKAWCGGDQDGTPDGAKLHSILIDPRDSMHMYIAMSSGGVFESNDGGADWHPLNQGVRADFQPNPDIEYGHDPHCVRFAAGNPDRLYQQNHCGLFRLDRPATRWQATSDFRWCRIRTTPTPRGCFRWMAPMCGRASRRAASPPLIARAMAARRGSGRRSGCRRRRHGGRSSGRR